MAVETLLSTRGNGTGYITKCTLFREDCSLLLLASDLMIRLVSPFSQSGQWRLGRDPDVIDPLRQKKRNNKGTKKVQKRSCFTLAQWKSYGRLSCIRPTTTAHYGNDAESCALCNAVVSSIVQAQKYIWTIWTLDRSPLGWCNCQIERSHGRGTHVVLGSGHAIERLNSPSFSINFQSSPGKLQGSLLAWTGIIGGKLHLIIIIITLVFRKTAFTSDNHTPLRPLQSCIHLPPIRQQ